MEPFKIILLLLCSYISVKNYGIAYPITSQPLENNSDTLAWEAWLMVDSENPSPGSNGGSPYGGKSRKITAKSIFITPNFHNLTSQICPPGYKIDHRGQCIQIISINQDDLLVTRLQSFLSQTTDNAENGIKEDYYDYEDESVESNGPFQVNLPLTFDPEPINHSTFKEKVEAPDQESPLQSFLVNKPGDSDRKPEAISIPKTQQEEVNTTTVNTTIQESSTHTPSTTPSIIGVLTTDAQSIFDISVALSDQNETASSQVYIIGEVDLKINESMSNNETFIVSTVNYTDVEDIMDEDLEKLMNESFIIEDDVIESSNSSSKLNNESNDELNITTQINETDEFDENTTTESDLSETTTSSDLMDITDITFIVDQRTGMSSSSEKTLSSESSTESSTEEIYEEDMISGDDNETTYAASIIEDVSEKPKLTGTTNKTTIIMPTTQKSIVHLSHQQLTTPNNTDLDIKNREILLKQEQRMKDLERIDTNNRFVYHHLPNTGVTAASTVNRWYPSASGSPAFQPITASDQVQMVHRIVEAQKEQNKIRFPETSENSADNIGPIRTRDDSIPKPIVIKPDILRFPGASTNRFSVYPLTSNTNRPLVESFNGRKSISVSTTQKPFWWLPKEYEVDNTGQKPMLLRFWSKMPLVRDPALDWQNKPRFSNNPPPPPAHHYQSQSQQPINHKRYQNLPQQRQKSDEGHRSRENSKSPSENLYREMSSQDVYKVLAQKNWKHNNNR